MKLCLMILRLSLLWLVCVSFARAAETPLVTAGATWKYLDNGTNQGTAWQSATFDDSAWASGPAQLGYGDGDEATVVGFGPDANNKYVTTYFRRSFNVANPAAFTSVLLRLVRDDGAVVYLNGTEVWRSNMPATGAIGYQTFASSSVSGTDESNFFITPLSPSLLRAGANTLAVEIHQNQGNSSDISFDLSLSGADAPTVIRGPYLQMGTPTSVVARWRTDVPTDSRVSFGLTAGNLNSNADNSTVSTEHEVTLSGLTPNTRYFYSVGSVAARQAGDNSYYFYTSPTNGTAIPTRFWVLGDSGTANDNARAVRDAYQTFNGTTRTNLWLMLGDNAYANGTDSEYQAAVFDLYPTTLRQSVLWSTVGNHDTAQSTNPALTIPYFQIFNLPTNAQAGGLASGTEKYYSFDYSNIHFVCLDSMTSDRAPNGAMMTWLQSDLAATVQPWIVAFWHHPPYTKGSHDSDTEAQLVEMRANVLPVLESYGVDLVLTGHSHSYERSFLIDGHYGSSTTFTNAMKKNGGDGRPDGNGVYNKPAAVASSRSGAVYAVAGSSGQISGGPLNHPAMFISLNNLGSLVVDVNGARMDVKFIRENGAIADYFTITKNTLTALPPDAPAGLEARAVSGSQIDLSWTDHANDESGFRVERCAGRGCEDFAPAGFVFANILPAPVTFQDSGLNASTIYTYRVRAVNAAGTSEPSAPASAITPALPPAPANLTATATRRQINLSWTSAATPETVYNLERCAGENCLDFAPLATARAGQTFYADKVIKLRRAYRYRARATNVAGVSAYSEIVTAQVNP